MSSAHCRFAIVSVLMAACLTAAAHDSSPVTLKYLGAAGWEITDGKTVVLPTHWDRFNVTYEVSQEPALQRLQSFIAEVKAASPKTRVVVPGYFEPVAVP